MGKWKTSYESADTSSDIRVTSSNLRVTSSTLRGPCLNPRVTSSNPLELGD